MTPEQANVVRQCVRRGQWTEGLGYLAGPLRVAFYRWRHPRRSAPTLKNGWTPPAPVAEHPNPLWRDAELQAGGVYRLAGDSYHEVRFRGPVEWPDPEDGHAFHRLYWAARYARAFASGHSQSAAALVRDWHRWVGLAQLDHQVANAAYTVAERISSLAEVLFWSRSADGLLGTELQQAIEARIECDADHLAQNIEFPLGIHNHLLNDARGLAAAASAVPDAPGAEVWKDLALTLWEKYFPALVLGDGSFAEQSSHYHVLLCRTALEYFRFAKSAGRPLPDGFESKLKAMFALANDLFREDGSLPRFGDNSPDRTGKDLAGLLSAAAGSRLLAAPLRHGAVTPLTRLFGISEGTHSSSGAAVRLYPSGGYAFLRSPVSGAELAAHADPDPTPRAHGDAGRGSFELWWRGHVIIREPGCYLRPGHPRSEWYRSPKAQNVTCLDGLGPVLACNGKVPSWYRPSHGSWRIAPEGGVCFEDPAFERVHPHWSARRTWRFVGGALEFEEQLAGGGSARFESRLFLGDGPWGNLHKQTGLWTISSSTTAPPVSLFLTVPDTIQITLEQAQHTPEYGAEQPAEYLMLQGKIDLPIHWNLRCEFGKVN